jgi:hypothetical protein
MCPEGLLFGQRSVSSVIVSPVLEIFDLNLLFAVCYLLSWIAIGSILPSPAIPAISALTACQT